MRIVNIDEDYKNYILKENRFPKFHNFGLGLYIFLKENHIFIPITSKKITHVDKDNRYLYIGKDGKYGTLLIGSYVYVKTHLVKEAILDKRINDEFIYFQSKEKLIRTKLTYQINRSIGNDDDNKLLWLSEFLAESLESNKNKAIKYAKKAIQSMAVIEKIKMPQDEIDTVMNLGCLGRTDVYEIKTILNLKDTWEYLVKTLEVPLTLEYIITINEKIANHQALEVGKIRDSINYVSGEFEIPIPNINEIKRLLKIVNNSKNIEINALKLFYQIITKQWFFDGNKRTAFVIANKIFIRNGIGLLLVDDTNKDEFEMYLYECYKKKSIQYKNEFIQFLNFKCLNRF